MNIAETNASRPREWSPTRREIEQIKQAVCNEAYPPAGRTGVGTVLRRVH